MFCHFTPISSVFADSFNKSHVFVIEPSSFCFVCWYSLLKSNKNVSIWVILVFLNLVLQLNCIKSNSTDILRRHVFGHLFIVFTMLSKSFKESRMLF